MGGYTTNKKWYKWGEIKPHNEEEHWGHGGYTWGDWGTYHGAVSNVVGYGIVLEGLFGTSFLLLQEYLQGVGDRGGRALPMPLPLRCDDPGCGSVWDENSLPLTLLGHIFMPLPIRHDPRHDHCPTKRD